jgi:hypothetical protein
MPVNIKPTIAMGSQSVTLIMAYLSETSPQRMKLRNEVVDQTLWFKEY